MIRLLFGQSKVSWLSARSWSSQLLNIRPVKIFETLAHLSLKAERIAGVDFVMVRELTGGIYFGDHILEEDKARDINDYATEEIERIVRRAFGVEVSNVAGDKH